MQAANQLTGGEHPVTVLLDDNWFRIDEHARLSHKRRLVYRINQKVAAARWGNVDVSWQPWLQNKPALQATVVSAGGRLHLLKDTDFMESAGSVGPLSTYNDARFLRAPLPDIGPGSLVEVVITAVEKRALAKSGVSQRLRFTHGMPVLFARVVIDAPDAVPLHVLNGVDNTQARRKKAGHTMRHSFLFQNLQAFDGRLVSAPPDIDPFPFIAFSTVPEWTLVSGEYAEMIAEAIDVPGVQALAHSSASQFADTRARIRAVLRRLHRAVRYEAVEFGESSIIPRSATQTLKNRYGDCKDKAVLLVSMLRALGIAADVALIKAGPGPDVLPGLPGLGEFNHAIVYLPAQKLFIDPTDPYAEPGVLPDEVQGRWALIIADKGGKLIQTPQLSSQQNVVRSTRTVRMTEQGAPTIHELIEAEGGEERSLRGYLASLDEQQSRRWVEAYARSTFGARTIGTYSWPEPDDLSSRFRIELVAYEGQRGRTEKGGATYVISLMEALQELPAPFLIPAAENPFKGDTALSRAYIADTTYKVVAPDGYEISHIPTGGSRNLGVSQLHWEVQKTSSSEVRIRMVFDTVKQRFSAHEADALRLAVRRVAESSPLVVRFEQVARRQLDEGEVATALRSYQESVVKHPDEALHYIEFSDALLRVGLGEASRTVAHHAVKLAPDSAEAHLLYGQVLSHDLLGRAFEIGHDRQAAMRLLQTALELEPENGEARIALARLLEYAPSGEHFGAGADLDGAIRHYLEARARGHTSVDDALMHAMLVAGRYDTLREFAEKESRAPARFAYLMATLALGDGAQAAVNRSLTMNYVARQNALGTASDLLVGLRRYSLAATILEASAHGSMAGDQLASRAQRLRSVRLTENMKFDITVPDDFIRSYLKRAYMATLDDQEKLASYYTNATRLAYFSQNRGSEVLLQPARSVHRVARAENLTKQSVIDLLLSSMQIKVEGNEVFGYRVSVQSFTAEGRVREENYFVVREHGSLRIVGTPDLAPALAFQLFGYIDANQRMVSAKWVQWLLEFTELSDAYLPFVLLAQEGYLNKAEGLRVATLALLMDGPGRLFDTGIVHLAEMLDTKDEFLLSVIHVALAKGYHKHKRWEELEAVLARTRYSPVLFPLRADLLMQSGRYQELEKFFTDSEPFEQQRLELHRARSRAAEARGAYREAHAWAQEAIEHHQATVDDYTRFGWLAMLTGSVNAETEEAVRKALSLTHGLDTDVLDLLAAVCAENGNAAESREAMLRSLSLQELSQPRAQDWFVLGRLAERYGIESAARSSYQRVKPGKGLDATVYVITQRRIDGLQKSDRG